MWKGLGALLTANPARKYMVGRVTTALTLEDADRILKAAFPSFAKHGTIQSVANGVLVIKAKNSIGMQDLTLRKPPMIRTLKDNGIEIRDLRVIFGSYTPNQYASYGENYE